MNDLSAYKRFPLLIVAALLAILGNAQDNPESIVRQAKHPTIVTTQGVGPENNIFCSLMDSSGNLWCGTRVLACFVLMVSPLLIFRSSRAAFLGLDFKQDCDSRQRPLSDNEDG